MSTRFEWASVGNTSFDIVEHGYDVAQAEYLAEPEMAEMERGETVFEGVVTSPVAVVLSYDEGFVLEGSAVKIRALLRSIDQSLETYVQEEQANVIEHVESPKELPANDYKHDPFDL